MLRQILEKAKNGQLTKKQISAFIKNNNDINTSTDENQKTALHLAAENNHVEVVKLLLWCGADPKVLDAKGNTPLHLACKELNYGVIELLLLKHPANFNYLSENDAQMTPFMEYLQVRTGENALAKALQITIFEKIRQKFVEVIQKSLAQHSSKQFSKINPNGKIIFFDSYEEFNELTTKNKDLGNVFSTSIYANPLSPTLLFNTNKQLSEDEKLEAILKADLLHKLPFDSYAPTTRESAWLTILKNQFESQDTHWRESILRSLEKIQNDPKIDGIFKKLMSNFETEFKELTNSPELKFTA